MNTKAIVTVDYGKCSPTERANLIYSNYATFEVIIECFKEDLINDIESEQQYIKRQSMVLSRILSGPKPSHIQSNKKEARHKLF